MVTARCVIENPCCRHQNGGNCQFLIQVKLAGIVLFGWLKKKLKMIMSETRRKHYETFWIFGMVDDSGLIVELIGIFR